LAEIQEPTEKNWIATPEERGGCRRDASAAENPCSVKAILALTLV